MLSLLTSVHLYLLSTQPVFFLCFIIIPLIITEEGGVVNDMLCF